MIEKVETELGPIDTLVNNAGIETIIPFLELTDEQWTRLTDINLRGAWLVSQVFCKRAIPAARKGSIVNIGSIQAAKVLPGRTHYAPTKLGLEALTRNMSAEVTPLGIRVNCVHPGLIETDMTDWVMKSPDILPIVLQQISLVIFYRTVRARRWRLGREIVFMKRMMIAGLICLIPLWGAEPKPIPPIKFTDTRLPNGLRVIVSEDHYAPVVAIAVSYAVGSKDEKVGRTGFAHLFEHMLFQGSENVGRGEHTFSIQSNGGSYNGTTNTDRTLYFETLPKNQLDLGLFLEADRMRALAVTKENLENQRQVVKEERRLRVDNVAYGPANLRLDELAYDTFGYKHSVIGSMADLDAASLEDVKEFFRIYYAPNNATIAIVGDVNTKIVLDKVRKYFGNIPRQAAPRQADLSQGAQNGERRERLEDKLARLPRIDTAYRVPPGNTVDYDVLSVLSQILTSGQSSRMYQSLVKEKQLATNVSSGGAERIGPGLFFVTVTASPGKTVEEVEAAAEMELERLRTTLVTEKELLRAKTAARREQVNRSLLGTAQDLADYAVLFNDPGRINTLEKRRRAVTAQQIKDAANKYFLQSNRSVMIAVPATASAK